MSKTHRVLEYSSPQLRGTTIVGVKIIGTQSARGYAYPSKVLQEAKELYESAPVFICHPDPREKKQGSRLLRDHLGNLENVSGNGNGLFGDLAVKRSHPIAKQILEALPNASFGLSHNAVVEMNDDETEVTRIAEVNSVDLVDDPATTKNLFEETGTMTEELATLTAAVTELNERFEALEKRTKQSDRVTALETRGENDGDLEPIGNTHDDFLAQIRGFALK